LVKILRNTITILSEIAILTISIFWYLHSKDYESLIAIIVAGIGLITSLLSRLFVRPKLILHKQKNNWGRSPKGYTADNSQIIRVGIDNPEKYWELEWKYQLEIRNNSSEPAYYIEIKYSNLPPKTEVKGQIGKIEPLTPHEKRIFEIKLIQHINGTHIEADNYLKINADILTEKLIITLKYKDESGTSYYTIYNWVKDENKLTIC
jgi:hypothetical protein